MRSLAPTFTAATVLALSAAATAGAQARAPAPPASASAGRIESDEGRVEILGRTLRAGDTIELPEGFLRVEEDGREDRQIGSFTVVAARNEPPASAADGSAAPGAAPGEGAAAHDAAGPLAARPAAGAPSRTTPDCRAQRSAYLAELLRLSGVEVSSPADLIEGLDGSASGPAAGFYWFALQTDPFRPLAWSSELRSRAEALTRCVRGG